jgi:hypothetical protein
MIILTFVNFFFFVMDLISDNFWSKCESVNGVSLFEMTVFMFVGGDIEYQLILMCSCSLPL